MMEELLVRELGGKRLKKVRSFIEIEGCRVTGKVKIYKSNDGMSEFGRTLIDDSHDTTYIVFDRFVCTESGIGREVEIEGNDRPRSVPVNTIFKYPAGKKKILRNLIPV